MEKVLKKSECVFTWRMISIKRKKKSKKQNDWGTAWINKHFGLFLLSEAYPASFKSFLAFPKQIGSFQDQKFIHIRLFV